MQNVNTTPFQEPCAKDFPELAKLGLNDGDLLELRNQGFISLERRGSRSYFKLRYRRNGKQTVRYLGGRDAAEAIELELSQLQRDRRLAGEQKEITRRARAFLRDVRSDLTPWLTVRGLTFHGVEIRRSRIPRPEIPRSSFLT